MTYTLADALTDLGYELKDVSDVPTATFIKWCDYINQYAYRYLIGLEPSRYISSSSYTVTSKPQTSALPTNFRDMSELGCGLFYVENDGRQTATMLLPSGFGSQDTGYYLSGTNVVFTGMDDGSVWTLRYIPKITALTALTESFVIPEEYNEYIINALKVAYFIWDEDPSSESTSDFRFIRSLDELKNSFKRDGNVVSLNNF